MVDLLHAEGERLIARVKADRMGFVTDRDVEILAADPRTRLTQLVVRCGGCRFVCAAQDAKHLIGIIESTGKDYVRDVALVAEREVVRG